MVLDCCSVSPKEPKSGLRLVDSCLAQPLAKKKAPMLSESTSAWYLAPQWAMGSTYLNNTHTATPSMMNSPTLTAPLALQLENVLTRPPASCTVTLPLAGPTGSCSRSRQKRGMKEQGIYSRGKRTQYEITVNADHCIPSGLDVTFTTWRPINHTVTLTTDFETLK